MNPKCTLCQNQNSRIIAQDKFRSFFQCETCSLVFANNHLDSDEELRRYQQHNNATEDEGQINFQKTILDFSKDYLDLNFEYLDFGCGPFPVLTRMLNRMGINNVKSYDPFFGPMMELSDQTFDFVFSVEVVEHFNNPRQTFDLILSHMRPGSYLAFKTKMYQPDTNFVTWYYARDLTHVSFYQEKTIEYFEKIFNLKLIKQDKEHALFQML